MHHHDDSVLCTELTKSTLLRLEYILYHTVGVRNRWNGFMDWEEEGRTELKLIIIDNWTKIDNELKRESETLAAWTKVFLSLLLPPTLFSAPTPDSLAVLLIIVLFPFTTSTLALPLLPDIWDITAIPSLVQLGTTWCNQWLVGIEVNSREMLWRTATGTERRGKSTWKCSWRSPGPGSPSNAFYRNQLKRIVGTTWAEQVDRHGRELN